MATTTNYGWTTPDDTALVKDGAAAIRTLGSSVDTTTKNLNPETTLGDIAYRSSTANVKTRLGIGTTGQILTVSGGVPAWSTPASSASGLTFITGGTFSAVSTLNVNNCFTSTYANYKIIINITAAGGGGSGGIRMRASSTDTTTGYNCQRFRADDATYAGFENQDGTGQWVMSGWADGTPTVAWEMDLYSPQLARRTMGLGRAVAHSAAENKFDVGTGNSLDNSTQYDGFSFLTSGTTTGEYRVYGYQNS